MVPSAKPPEGGKKTSSFGKFGQSTAKQNACQEEATKKKGRSTEKGGRRGVRTAAERKRCHERTSAQEKRGGK